MRNEARQPGSRGPADSAFALRPVAPGALHYAYDRGIAVPSGLFLVGFDNATSAPFIEPARANFGVPRAVPSPTS